MTSPVDESQTPRPRTGPDAAPADSDATDVRPGEGPPDRGGGSDAGPSDPEPAEVTALLRALRSDDEQARNRLAEMVYDDLRGLAARQLARHGGEAMLQPTALVNECFLRLLGRAPVDYQDRRHFFAMAARAMRDIVVDEGRRRRAGRRGGNWRRVSLDGAGLVQRDIETVALGAVLQRLADMDPLGAEIVTLRFLGGLTQEQVAETLDLPVIRVRREWYYARAVLLREVERDAGHEGEQKVPDL